MSGLDPFDGVPRRMTITHWEGDLPEPGSFMRSAGGTLYLVTGIRPCRADAKSIARLDLIKFPRGFAPTTGCAVHSFAWNKRAPKRRCHERRRR